MRFSGPIAHRLAALLGVLALGALTTPSGSIAAPAPPAQPLQDSVMGRALTVEGVDFEITARSGPSGENPTGQVTFRSGGSANTGTVTCLTVHANVALLKAEFVSADLVTLVSLRITDLPVDFLGRPQDRVDVGLTSTAASECSSPEATYFSEQRVFTGDITVVDAPSLPTSKEQCKNGGYSAYGFKNQGECVAFVDRGPKPKP
jgi:hypothetical protein